MMLKNNNLAGALLLMAGVFTSPLAAAFFGDMMNPSRWFGGDRDYHDDYYYDGPRGPGYGPGYYGGPAGYAAPGYPPPGYAAPPAYGYGAPAHPAPPAHTPPAARDDAASSEITKLKQRIEQLEQERAASSMAGQGHFSQPGYAPAATAAPHKAYTPPPVRPLTPETTADMVGHGGPAGGPAAPAPAAGPAGKPQAPAGEWRPSGYFHPAMQ
jgi:hypothetical protein